MVGWRLPEGEEHRAMGLATPSPHIHAAAVRQKHPMPPTCPMGTCVQGGRMLEGMGSEWIPMARAIWALSGFPPGLLLTTTHLNLGATPTMLHPPPFLVMLQ